MVFPETPSEADRQTDGQALESSAVQPADGAWFPEQARVRTILGMQEPVSGREVPGRVEQACHAFQAGTAEGCSRISVDTPRVIVELVAVEKDDFSGNRRRDEQ